MTSLTFFHTSPVHVATFDALLAELAPDMYAQHLARHVVDEALLREARDAGRMTLEMQAKVQARMAELGGEGVVLCTCSTIGGCAEAAASNVIRADRPMAARAVQLGSRIIVVATLRSTIEPTRDLVLGEARRAGKQVEVIEVLCEGAWQWFEKGEPAQYLQAIATTLEQVAEQGDVIALAQASMAGAATLCAHLGKPILSSPRIGLETALEAYRIAALKGGAARKPKAP
jgi:hypothetical protein